MRVNGHTIFARRIQGFLAWALLSVVISLVGFWPSYLVPMAAGTYRDIVPLMPLHVVSTGLWLLLLVIQPSFIILRRRDLHRKAGWFGLIVAIAVVFTGFLVQAGAMGVYAARGDATNAVVLPFFRLVTLSIFAICIGLAILLRRRSDWHMRLILLGTFSMLEAPLGRIFEHQLGLGEISGLLGAITHVGLMIGFLVWDRLSHGRFHPVTTWGAALITVVIFGTAPLAGSEWWSGVAAQLASIGT